MRFIGSLPDFQTATRFGDYLTALGIANDIEQGAQGFSVWIHNDDHIERSKSELTSFLTEPHAGRFTEASKAAQRVRDEQERREQSLQKNYIDYRTRFAGFGSKPIPLTIALVAISLLVAALTKLNAEPNEVAEWLSFGTLTSAQIGELTAKEITEKVRESFGLSRPPQRTFQLKPPGLENILHGQIWRLITPIFLHFGAMHLIFNMMWLVDLGAMIERKRGTLVLLLIVLATGVFANVAQFYWTGPYGGGMSGVVYGLFGYVWVKSKVEPQLGLQVGQQTIMLMLAWMVICMAGLIGNVGNAAHLIGLITGMVLAHAPKSWRKLRQNQRAA